MRVSKPLVRVGGLCLYSREFYSPGCIPQLLDTPVSWFRIAVESPYSQFFGFPGFLVFGDFGFSGIYLGIYIGVTLHSPSAEEQAGVARNTFPLGGCERFLFGYS